MMRVVGGVVEEGAKGSSNILAYNKLMITKALSLSLGVFLRSERCISKFDFRLGVCDFKIMEL